MTLILIYQNDLHGFDVRWLQYQAYTGIRVDCGTN